MSQVCRFLNLPLAVQEEIAARLRQNGYGNYIALAEELQRRGYKISKSALHRYIQTARTDAEFLRAWALQHPVQAAVVVAALKAAPRGGFSIKLPAEHAK
jgi:hypothetical protein